MPELDALIPWLMLGGVVWVLWSRRTQIASWLDRWTPDNDVLVVPDEPVSRPRHTHRSGDQRVLCVLDLIRDMEAAGKVEIGKFLRDHLADFGDSAEDLEGL